MAAPPPATVRRVAAGSDGPEDRLLNGVRLDAPPGYKQVLGQGQKERKRGVARGRAMPRPPDFLGRVNICRANKADSSSFFQELIKRRGMVKSLTDISIFPMCIYKC